MIWVHMCSACAVSAQSAYFSSGQGFTTCPLFMDAAPGAGAEMFYRVRSVPRREADVHSLSSSICCSAYNPSFLRSATSVLRSAAKATKPELLFTFRPKIAHPLGPRPGRLRRHTRSQSSSGERVDRELGCARHRGPEPGGGFEAVTAGKNKVFVSSGGRPRRRDFAADTRSLA